MGEGLILAFSYHTEETFQFTKGLLGYIRQGTGDVLLVVSYIHGITSVETEGVGQVGIQESGRTAVDVIELVIVFTNANPIGGGILGVEAVVVSTNGLRSVFTEERMNLIDLGVGHDVGAVAHIHAFVDVQEGVFHGVEVLRDVALAGELHRSIVDDERVATLYRLHVAGGGIQHLIVLGNASIKAIQGLGGEDGIAEVGDLDLTTLGAGIAAGSRAVERSAQAHISAGVSVGGWCERLGVVVLAVQIDVAVTSGGGVGERNRGIVLTPVGSCIHILDDLEVGRDVVTSINVFAVRQVDGVLSDVDIRGAEHQAIVACAVNIATEQSTAYVDKSGIDVGFAGGGGVVAEQHAVVGVTAAAIHVVVHGAATHVDGLQTGDENAAFRTLGAAKELALDDTSVHVDDDIALGGALVAAAKHVAVDRSVGHGHRRGQGVVNSFGTRVAHGAVLATAIHVFDGAAVDGHRGVSSNVGIGARSSSHTLSGTVNVMQGCLGHGNAGVLYHGADLAAAIHVVLHLDGGAVDIHYGVFDQGKLRFCGIAAAGAEDLAAIGIAAHANDGGAAHGDMRGLGHGRHVAATVDVGLHGAASHVHVGVVERLAGSDTHRAVAASVLSTATAEDVAVNHAAVVADAAARHGHMGVVPRVAVVAGAEHAAFDVGTVFHLNVGVVNVSQMLEGNGNSLSSNREAVGACHTTACTEHAAVVGAVDADGAAFNGDVGVAARAVVIRNLATVVDDELTHGGQRAAAIHVVKDAAAGDVDIGVAQDFACRGADGMRVGQVDTTAAAIHVATVDTEGT